MKVVFRVDSSSKIGSGHLMRCMTLAQRLAKEKGADVLFVMRDLDGNLINLVEERKFSVAVLPKAEKNENLKGYAEWLTVTQERDAKETIGIISKETVDLLIVDSYAIDSTWESIVRPYVKEIMVIDDLANRKHDCDVLLDQNFYRNKDSRYDGIVPKDCKLFLGPQYAILREEFYEARKHLKNRDGSINNILVFFGGVDFTNETKKTLEAIVKLEREDITVNVIVGRGNPHKEEIKEICDKFSYMHYYCQVSNIAEFMNEADLAIGAGGTTTWERCFLGLPSIVIAVAQNQVAGCNDCFDSKLIYYLGEASRVTLLDIYGAIAYFLNEKALLSMISSCKITSDKEVDVE